MKVRVRDILPNPYRNVAHYPFDKGKIESLKRSIQEKTFWDNILLRQKGDKFELAYGHHRLEALKQLKIQEIDVPVRSIKDIPDSLMVQIMAEENLDWSMSPNVINQTVDAAKKYLDGELGKYEDFEKCPDGFIRSLFTGKKGGFEHAKEFGVGRETILKFLGGNWKGWAIQEALDSLGYSDTAKKKGKVDLEAIGMIPSLEQAKAFKRVVREHNLGAQKQRQLAKKIATEKVGRRNVEDAANEFLPPAKLKTKQHTPKPLPMLDDFVKDVTKKMSQLYRELVQIDEAFDCIQKGENRTALYLSARDLQRMLTKILDRRKR